MKMSFPFEKSLRKRVQDDKMDVLRLLNERRTICKAACVHEKEVIADFECPLYSKDGGRCFRQEIISSTEREVSAG